MSNNQPPLRFAVLGLALSHPYSFASYLEEHGHSIASVWDPDPDKAAEYAAAHGSVVLQRPEDGIGGCDAVIVTSVISDHMRLARPWLEAGVPAFVDKFLSLHPVEAEEMVAIARRAAGVLMSASCIRFLPAWAALNEQVRTGSAGIPLSAVSTCYHGLDNFREGPSAWQDDPALSGGSLMNMGIHCTDPLIGAFGTDVEAVSAVNSKRVHAWSRSEDQALINLRWSTGVLATVRVVCGLKRFRYHLQVTTSETELEAEPGPEPANVYGPMLDAFVQGVRSGKWPLPAEELLANVKVLAAARRSADRGEWVWLNAR